MDNRGNVFVLDSFQHKVEKFDSSGRFLLEYGKKGFQEGAFFNPQSLVSNVLCKNISYTFVVDAKVEDVQKFSENGEFIQRIQQNTSLHGTFIEPKSVGTFGSFVYVADSGKKSVQKFERKKGGFFFHSSLHDFPNGTSVFVSPVSVSVDGSSATTFVADSVKCQVIAFTYFGEYRASFGSFGDSDGQFLCPSSIAVDGTKGSVFVADRMRCDIQVFSSSFHFLFKFGGKGNGRGAFLSPIGVAVDTKNGFVYVLDNQLFSVQKFDSNGKFLLSFGSNGNKHGSFLLPSSITVDESCDVIVSDLISNNLQKFNSNGTFLSSTTVLSPQAISTLPGCSIVVVSKVNVLEFIPN